MIKFIVRLIGAFVMLMFILWVFKMIGFYYD